MQALGVVVGLQVEVEVRVANWAFSFWAARPFWRTKEPEPEPELEEEEEEGGEEVPDEEPDEEDPDLAGAGEDAGAGAGDAAGGAGAAGGAEEPDEFPAPTTPGFCVKSTNCVPSAIGPAVLAGQLPAGDTGAERPNGMVDGAPTLRPPTKEAWLAPWY